MGEVATAPIIIGIETTPVNNNNGRGGLGTETTPVNNNNGRGGVGTETTPVNNNNGRGVASGTRPHAPIIIVHRCRFRSLKRHLRTLLLFAGVVSI